MAAKTVLRRDRTVRDAGATALYSQLNSGSSVTLDASVDYRIKRHPKESIVTGASAEDSLPFDEIINRYEDAWQLGDRPQLATFLRDIDIDAKVDASLLQELVLIDLEWQWRADDSSPFTAEDYVRQYRSLLDGGTVPAWLIAEEYRVRHNWGDCPSHATYVQRFPERGTEITRMLSEIDGELRQEKNDAMPEPAVRSQLGRYRILECIGAGGFGVVYRARDDELSRDVAIKVPYQERIATESQAEEFVLEARTVAGLDHPGIVPVYDVGIDDGVCYVVSKFIESVDLSRRIHGQFSFSQIVEMVAGVAEALHHAHLRHVTHRDIKPANILVGHDGRTYVADFGLAVRDADVRVDLKMAGTPAYMSPEQARGEGHRLDGRTDIFSLGVVFYELMTGRKPFHADGTRKLLETIKRVEPRPPRQLNDAIPRELERICLKALAKRVSERYLTAADLADDLRGWEPSSDSARPISVGIESAHDQNSHHRTSGPLTDTGGSTRREIERAPVVVPRGLRSFDSDDADFFPALLPGPRGRDGLPDSIRFWMQRIESNADQQKFSVGLMYGPSGCGKSSLVKAGLLPRLGATVRTVYVEAAATGTEARILGGIRELQWPHGAKSVVAETGGTGDSEPDHSTDSPALGKEHLTELISAIRHGDVLPPGNQLLLIIDQFEQWLHAHSSPHGEELVNALRQCDGIKVQCLLLVRDDFWMSSCRFMAEVEVDLQSGRNVAVVDLFDKQHAAATLIRFGQAYGCLPADDTAITSAHKKFIRRAIDLLTDNDRVVCLSVALFADLVRNKPWSVETIAEYGGLRGLGVTFLDESFFSRMALPQHRLHADGARAVLQALLPRHSSDIRGGMRSRQELFEASAYTESGRDFDALLRILDADLRLITPADPPEDSSRDAVPQQAYYQLTHDYLVPSLTEWLSRQQRATFRGRLQLRMNDRTSVWMLRQEAHSLPSIAEFAAMQTLIPAAQRSSTAKRMMSAAARHYLTRTVVACLIMTCALFVGRSLWMRSQSTELLEQLSVAGPEQLATVVDELREREGWVKGQLQGRFDSADNSGDHEAAVRAGLVLIASDPHLVSGVVNRVGHVETELIGAVARGLSVQRETAVECLWQQLRTLRKSDRQGIDAGSILNSAIVLAVLDPNGENWTVAAPHVTQAMLIALTDRPNEYDVVRRSLSPVRAALLPPLIDTYRDDADSALQSLATSLLADYAADRIELLCDLIQTASASHFKRLRQPLMEHPARAIEHLLASYEQLDQPVTAEWPSVSASQFDNVPRECVVEVESAMGMLTSDFAVCQQLPLSRFESLSESLRPCGYRPIRFRPYREHEELQVAVIWLRDGRPWHFADAATKEEILSTNDRQDASGYVPVEAVCYLDQQDGLRFCALWSQRFDDRERGLTIGNTDAEQKSEGGVFNNQQIYPITYHRTPTVDNRSLISTVREWSMTQVHTTANISGGALREFYPRRFLTDLQCLPVTRFGAREAAQQTLAELQHDITSSPMDGKLMYDSARIKCELGDYNGALADFEAAAKTHPELAQKHRAIRGKANVRLGKFDDAKEDLRELTASGARWVDIASLSMIVMAPLGKDREVVEAFEKHAKKATSGRDFLDYALPFAFTAETLQQSDPGRSEKYATQAIDFIAEAIQRDSSVIRNLASDPAWMSFYDRPQMQNLIRSKRADMKFLVTMMPQPDLESRSLIDLSVQDHLQEMHRLSSDGFRPAAISVERLPISGVRGASVWHRPVASAKQRTRQRQAQCNVLIALFQLGETQELWPSLQHSATPDLRSRLIDRIAAFESAPDTILARLMTEQDISVRRALLLILGQYDPATIDRVWHRSFVDEIVAIWKNATDAGLHSAAEWVLRRHGHSDKVMTLQNEFRSNAVPKDREWYVNEAGQTLAIFRKPPVFRAGSPVYEPFHNDNELLHMRRIPRDFAIGTTEVTHEQYAEFLKAHPDRQSSRNAFAVDDQGPALSVHWHNAAAYCNWLSDRHGLEHCYRAVGPTSMQPLPGALSKTGYRLPTKGEHEFASRAGAETAWCFGDSVDLLHQYAWFVENSQERTWPVGLRKPNDFGMFDIHGNASEHLHPSRIGSRSTDIVIDGDARPQAGSYPFAGGSFQVFPRYLRSAFTNGANPYTRFADGAITLRLARTLSVLETDR